MAKNNEEQYSDPNNFLAQATIQQNMLIGYNGHYVSISKENLSGVTYISDKAFHEKTKTLRFGEDKWIENLELPDGITTIDKGMFENCKHLKSITLPDSVRYIGENAFKGCSNLVSIKVSIDYTSDNPAANQMIGFGANAFKGCTNLASFELAFNAEDIDSLDEDKKKIAVNKIFGLRSVYFGGENPLSKLPGLSPEKSTNVFKILLNDFNYLLKRYLNLLSPASRQIIQVVSSGSYYDLKKFVFETILLLPDGDRSPEMFVVGQPSPDSVLKMSMLANGTWTKHPRADFYYDCNLISSGKTLDEYYFDEKYREFYYYASSLGAKYISIKLIDTHYSGKGKEATSSNDANLNANVGSLADIHVGLDKETKDLEEIVSKITNSWSREYISSSSAKFDYKNGVWSKVEWNGMTQTLINKTGQRWEDEDNYTSYFSSNQLSSKKIDSELKIALNIEQIPDVKGEVSFDFLKKDLAWAKFWQDHKLKLIVEQDGYNPSPEPTSDDSEKKKNELPELDYKPISVSEKRSEDTARLYQELVNNQFLNLVGMGGTGKTCLANLFVEDYRQEFGSVVYTTVNNVFWDDVFGPGSTLDKFKDLFDMKAYNMTNYIQFNKFKYSGRIFKDLLNKLKEYESGKPNLWIIDVNETSDYSLIQTALNILFKEKKVFNWNVLLVSRTKLFPDPKYGTIEMTEMKNSHNVLTRIFRHYLGKKADYYDRKVADKELDLEDLFAVLFRLPLLVELLGRYLSGLNGKSKDEIYQYIGVTEQKRCLANAVIVGGVNEDKNEKYDIVSEYLSKLMFFDNLDILHHTGKRQREIARHLMLWPSEYYSVDTIWTLMHSDLFTDKDDLQIHLNYLLEQTVLSVKENEDGTRSYRMHGLVADAFRVQVLRESKVDEKYRDYSQYLANIKNLIKSSSEIIVCLSFCFAQTKKTSEAYLPVEFFDNNVNFLNAEFYHHLSQLGDVLSSEKWYKLKLIEDERVWNIKDHNEKLKKYQEYKNYTSEGVYNSYIKAYPDKFSAKLCESNFFKSHSWFHIPSEPLTPSDFRDSALRRPPELNIRYGYYISRSISNIEWENIMVKRSERSEGDNQPVVNVSWYDCFDYIIEINYRDGLRLRLPSVAELNKALYKKRELNKGLVLLRFVKETIEFFDGKWPHLWCVDFDDNHHIMRKIVSLGLVGSSGQYIATERNKNIGFCLCCSE